MRRPTSPLSDDAFIRSLSFFCWFVCACLPPPSLVGPEIVVWCACIGWAVCLRLVFGFSARSLLSKMSKNVMMSFP
ncbi:hypothetical protein B0J12DRAFT_672329 [Macrophomina phaseolina]|uniref:Secreted protein n=1 Tax=Macrophomina phaseolina TaxID=35725 RepID=A0ABQ8G2T4_9PEZI|nr:hypothetical protein B0J12DRAFT_672329 [Macrophomina phaseolina]